LTLASPPRTASDASWLTGVRRILTRLSTIAVVLLAGLALRLLIAYVVFPGQGHESDLHLYGVWAQTLAQNGPGGFYQNAGFADYPPGYLYVLWLLGVAGNVIAGLVGQAPADVIGALVKAPAIAADMVVGILLYRAARRWRDERTGVAAAALYLFLPVTSYDSALWGQVDAVGGLLLIGAILLLIEGWSEPATAVAVLAAVTKPQYAIGLAVVGAILLRRHLLQPGSGPVPTPGARVGRLDRALRGWLTRQQGPGRLVACAAVAILFFLAAILPFDLPSLAPAGVASVPILGSLAGFWALVGSAAGYYPVLTVNAFNVWALVGPTPLTQMMGPNLFWTYDSLQVLGPIPAATVGAGLLGLLGLLVGLTLLLRDDRQTILIAFTVLAVGFFVLPTRVHERYLFPAFAVGALLAASSVRWRWWYVLLGLANVANLHAVLTLPFQGYATPGLRGLPLADLARDATVVAAVAIGHTVLFGWAFVQFGRTSLVPALTELRSCGLNSLWRRSVGVAVQATSARGSPARRVGRRSRLAGLIAAMLSARRVDSSRPIEGPAAAVGEPGGRLDRWDFAMVVGLVVITFTMRVDRLGLPRSEYFDEYWHATTATEFLQDWRYGIPHDVLEWTHPHLAKYAMAGGIALFGDNRITGVSILGAPVRDAALAPAYAVSGDPKVLGGDRIVIATGADVRVAPHGNLDATTAIPLPGASAIAIDAAHDRVYVGTDGGEIYSFAGPALDAVATVTPPPALVARVAGPITHVWSVGGDRLITESPNDRLTLVDPASGAIVATRQLPGVAAVLPVTVASGPLAIAAVPEGLVELDPASLKSIASVSLPAPPKGLDLVDGSDAGRRERELLPQPTLYVATGAARVETVVLGPDGALTATGGFPMPGAVTDVRWDRTTNLVHVLGSTRSGQSTIYVVEPHGNAVFADVAIPFHPVAWLLDVQPGAPTLDRQRALVLAPAGTVIGVDVGSNAFAWRLPGVVAGALTAGLLYVLTRLLFRRRSVGLLLAAIVPLEGLLFTQSRIGMNDVYAGLFIVAAFTLLAYLLGSRGTGRAGRLNLLLGLPALGVVLGLALASKWVGVYAIAGVILVILLRSAFGRWLALAGVVGLTALFGYLAISDDPPNITFFLLMLAISAAFAAALVRRGASLRSALRSPEGGLAEPRWVEPRWRRGIPFAWALLCLTVLPVAVYVASYVPWALSTAGGPQLVAGWPPGHAGQTFLDLQAQMYQYHNELRIPHGASSPWWAWPFDLKPIWGYLERFVDGTEATVFGAGNVFLLWLSIPAVVFCGWQAWRRRSQALAFLLVAFLCLWLPWARIDRVAYNYHFYTALPFTLVLLAYFLAELWDGPSSRTWLLARASAIVVLLAPALLWIGSGPLCIIAGVDQANPGAAVCSEPVSSFVVPVIAWLVGGLLVSVGLFRLRRPRWLVAGVVGATAAEFVVLYPAMTASRIGSGAAWVYQGLLPSWDSGFFFNSNEAPVSGAPPFWPGVLVVLALTVLVAAGAMRLAGGRGLPEWFGRLWTTSGGPEARPKLWSWIARNPVPELALPPRAEISPAPALSRSREALSRVAAAARSAPAPWRGLSVSGLAGPVVQPLLSRFSVALGSGGWAETGRLPRTIAVHLSGARVSGLSLRATVASLALASFLAALIADRFAGPNGPWLWNYDLPLINYQFASFFHEALSRGGLPFWNDRIGMGFPLYADGQIGALYPPNWLIYQLPPLQALDVARLLHLSLAGVGAGLITLRLSGSRMGALATALVAVLCGGIVSKLEWTQVVTVYAWMPWVLLPLLWGRPAPGSRGVALAGILWGVQALGGHPPYWVLTGIAAAMILLARRPRLAGLRRLLVFGTLGLAVGAVQLIPTALLTTLSWRAQGVGSTSLFEFSATPFDFLGFAFANGFVPAQSPAWDVLNQSWYPGGVWATFEVYGYVGLVGMALGIVGLRLRRARALLVVAAVMIAIPLIGVLQPGIWAAIPGLNGLRHPIRAYLVLNLVLAVAAGLGVTRIGRMRDLRAPARVVGLILAGYAAVAGLAILLPDLSNGVVAWLWPFVPAGADDAVRQQVIRTMTSPWPLGFELIVLGLAFLVLRVKRRLPIARLAAVALLVAPLAILVPGINQSLPASAFSLDGTSIANTLRQLAPQQVLTVNEPFYGGFADQLAGVGARDPHIYTSQLGLSLRLQASEDLIGLLRSTGVNTPLARALGVDTVVSFGAHCIGREVAVDTAYNASICHLDGAVRPPYWMPADAVALPPAAGGSAISPVDAVVSPDRAVSGAVSGTVLSWDEGQARIAVTAPAAGYVFIDRTWYPTWHVSVDGMPVTPLRAWGAQLVPVTAGSHRIEEQFVPWDAGLGLVIGIGALVLAGLWFSPISRPRRPIRFAPPAWWPSRTNDNARSRFEVTLKSPRYRRYRVQPPAAGFPGSGETVSLNTPLATRIRSMTFVRERWVQLALVAVGVCLPALLFLASGSLEISHNDDFNYRRVALGLYETGQVQLTGWTVMSLIGQLVFVQPFLWLSGGGPWAFAAATAVLAVVGIVASYKLARRLLPVPLAIFAVLTMLFFPGFLLNTTSFMTDVPALAGEMVCLALGAVALDRQGSGRLRLLIASIVAGCFAFSIREFAIAAPVAVLVTVVAADRGRLRPYVVAGGALLAACAAIYIVTANLPGQGSASLQADPFLSPYSVDRVLRATATLALVMLPTLVLASARWRSYWHVRDLAIGSAIGVLVYRDDILTALTTGGIPRLLVGNLLEPDGAPGGYGALAGTRPLLFGPPIWDLINAIALVAVVVFFGILGAILGRALRRREFLDVERLRAWIGSTAGLLVIFVALYGAQLVAFGLVASTFDRYLWPLAVPLCAVLLTPPPTGDRTAAPKSGVEMVALRVAGWMMVGLAVISLVLLLNSVAFDAARWRMGGLAVSRGFEPETVDAGMEWVGYHATGVATVKAEPTRTEMWYDAWWPSFRLCAIVSSSPLDLPGFGLEATDIDAYRLMFFAGPQEPLYLYRVSGPGCP
jgi:4-amino-4-deoxy-L-arabinose transferase-like glycosyltransferase